LVFAIDVAAGIWAPALALLGAVAVVAAVVTFQLRLMRLPALTVVWVPLGTAFTVLVLLWSMLLFASGRGVVWRGRRYGASFDKLRMTI
jgi:hypothetical protein